VTSGARKGAIKRCQSEGREKRRKKSNVRRGRANIVGGWAVLCVCLRKRKRDDFVCLCVHVLSLCAKKKTNSRILCCFAGFFFLSCFLSVCGQRRRGEALGVCLVVICERSVQKCRFA